MTEQQEQSSIAAASTPGEWLRQERERQGRTVQQIAADLHLGTHMVEAMENNQFAVLGAPVFARGHLRKYAGLLGVSPERVQELYQNLSDRPRDPDHVPVIHRDTEPSIPMSPDSKDRAARFGGSTALVVAVGALLVLFVAAWWWFGVSTPKQASETAPNPSVTTIVDTGPAIEETNQSSTSPVVESREVAQPTTPAALPAQQPPATKPLARGKVRLRFNFSQESWVEVYDARGNRMLYDVGQPGQTRGVDVEAPAQVVLGLAAGVTTEVNGREVAVPPKRIASQVARFTVTGDGAVQ